MSIVITFKASLYDGEDRNNPRQPFPAGRVYLSVQAETSDEQYAGAISGWVRPEVRSLVKAAPDLLDVIRDYLESGFDVADTPLRQRARAVFTKATGEA
jgi:hypothetical protein